MLFEVAPLYALHPAEGLCFTCILAKDKGVDDNQLCTKVTSNSGGVQAGISGSSREVSGKDDGSVVGDEPSHWRVPHGCTPVWKLRAASVRRY
jgi:hypothetical protein